MRADKSKTLLIGGAGFVCCKHFEGEGRGYVFKLGDQGLGYYNDVHAVTKALPSIICLDSIIPHSRVSHDMQDFKVTTYSRPLGKKGKRRWRPKRDRRQVVNKQHTLSHATVPDIDDIEVEEAWWVQRGLWAIETCNANSWESGKSAVLAKSKADVVFLQETRFFPMLRYSVLRDRRGQLVGTPPFPRRTELLSTMALVVVRW